MATIRLHLEVNQDGTGGNGPVEVTRSKFRVNVDKEPFLVEGDVARAAVIESVGGFAIQINFNSEALFKLDMMTSSHKGKHIAILCQYPKGKTTPKSFSRWVAAPMITKRIANGIFIFTPDCTREEADRLVLGLNNVADFARKAESDHF